MICPIGHFLHGAKELSDGRLRIFRWIINYLMPNFRRVRSVGVMGQKGGSRNPPGWRTLFRSAYCTRGWDIG
jgi:hypothetical protein